MHIVRVNFSLFIYKTFSCKVIRIFTHLRKIFWSHNSTPGGIPASGAPSAGFSELPLASSFEPSGDGFA